MTETSKKAWVTYITAAEKEDGGTPPDDQVKMVAAAMVASGLKTVKEAEGFNFAHVKKDGFTPPMEAMLV